MNDTKWILLLITLVAIYWLIKNNSPYPDFKKWLDCHPQQKSKLEQEVWDQFFIDPETKELQTILWDMATFKQPTPDNLLPANKILISIIRTYLREQKGIEVKQNLVKK